MLQQQGQIPSCTLAETLLPQPLHPTFPLAPTAPFNAGRASGKEEPAELSCNCLPARRPPLSAAVVAG